MVAIMCEIYCIGEGRTNSCNSRRLLCCLSADGFYHAAMFHVQDGDEYDIRDDFDDDYTDTGDNDCIIGDDDDGCDYYNLVLIKMITMKMQMMKIIIIIMILILIMMIIMIIIIIIIMMMIIIIKIILKMILIIFITIMTMII